MTGAIRHPFDPSRAGWQPSKVPRATAYFWAIMILATTVGETAADLLSADLGLGAAATISVVGGPLAVALLAQFRSTRYVPGIYWPAVVLISIAGTLVADSMIGNLGISLLRATIACAGALLLIFSTWYLSERTLSNRTIVTSRREAFYWLALLGTFALGTAAGDLTYTRLDLGHGASALLFGGLILAAVTAHLRGRLDTVPAFWTVYILLRPLGVSLGDGLAQHRADGGLGLGTVSISTVFLAAIAGLVAFLAVTRSDESRA